MPYSADPNMRDDTFFPLHFLIFFTAYQPVHACYNTEVFLYQPALVLTIGYPCYRAVKYFLYHLAFSLS